MLVDGPRASTPLRRWQIAGAILVLLVLGAIRLSMTHQDRKPTTASTTSVPTENVPTPSPITPIGPRPGDVTPGDPGSVNDDPSHCPDFLLCTSTKTVPAAMIDAVRAHLTAARARFEFSVIQRSPRKLFFRQLNATSGATEILVLVSQVDRADPRDARPTEQTSSGSEQSIAFARRVTPDGYLVEVEVTGAARTQPQLAAARALAADPRMLALG